MAELDQSNGQDKWQQDTIEQLDLAHQVLEKAKEHVVEAQNVLQDTKEALEQQGNQETGGGEDST